jgi:hypothetical protein
MFRQTFSLGTLLVLSALSATACQAVPNPAPAPAPSTAAQDAPAAAPTPSRAAQGEPVAPPLPDRSRIESALRLAGLSGGVVTAKKDGALTLRSAGRFLQVRTNDQTIVVVPGKTSAQIADIRVGDRVITDFGRDTTNTTAAFLLDLPADYGTGNIRLGAVVASKPGVVNLRTRNGADKAATSDATMVIRLGGNKPTVGAVTDLQPGSVVVVIGQESGDTFNAQVVVATGKDARARLNHSAQK